MSVFKLHFLKESVNIFTLLWHSRFLAGPWAQPHQIDQLGRVFGTSLLMLMMLSRLFHVFQMLTDIFNLTNATFETCPTNPHIIASFPHYQILIKGVESDKAKNVYSLNCRKKMGDCLWIACPAHCYCSVGALTQPVTSCISEWEVTSWEGLY